MSEKTSADLTGSEEERRDREDKINAIDSLEINIHHLQPMFLPFDTPMRMHYVEGRGDVVISASLTPEGVLILSNVNTWEVPHDDL